MQTYTCGHCGATIKPKPFEKLYRTCDAYVCNSTCQRQRLNAIAKIDPQMENPLIWTDILSSKYDAPIKRKPSHIGLQDLETGNGETTPLINPKPSSKDDGTDIITVTFGSQFNLCNVEYKQPNSTPPFQYIAISCAVMGSALLLLAL